MANYMAFSDTIMMRQIVCLVEDIIVLKIVDKPTE